MVEVQDGRLVMGGYATTEPTVYVVAWPEAGVIKNGYSERQRWRKFVLRGAEVVALYRFPSDFSAAFQFEAYLEGKASMLYPRAFPEKCDEAARLLGPDCGGYAECFRADPDEWTSLLPSSARLAMLKHPPTLMLTGKREQCHVAPTRTDATYALTQSMAENQRSPDLP